MADLIRARFIYKILQEEGGRFLDRQTSQIQAKVKERSGRLLSGRRFQVYGSDGDFDGELVFTHPIYERFLDIRHLGGREKGTRRQIHVCIQPHCGSPDDGIHGVHTSCAPL